jgi:cytochrome c553
MKRNLLLTTAALAAVFVLGTARGADVGSFWANNCAACHGKDGAGHTKAGRMRGVKDLSAAAYQKTFTDAEAASRIKDGLTDKAGKVRMKAFGDVLSADDIQGLVAHVRSLQK